LSLHPHRRAHAVMRMAARDRSHADRIALDLLKSMLVRLPSPCRRFRRAPSRIAREFTSSIDAGDVIYLNI
jgi:hypothetical protein